MSPTSRAALALTLVAGLAPWSPAQSIQVKIDPKAAFLRTWAGDAANDAVPVPLATLGAVQGKSLHITAVGDFDNGPAGDELDVLHAVFSASATLLPKTEQFRVLDALDAGKDMNTGTTAFSFEPTNIPEDFLVSNGPSQTEVVVQVPAGATHLFVAIPDEYFQDNSDPDLDYYAVITVVGTWTDLGHGLAGTDGTPTLAGAGLMLGNDPWTITLEQAKPNANDWLVLGFGELVAPFKGGVLVPSPDVVLGPLPTGPTGTLVLATTWPAGVPSGASVWVQHWIQDAAGPLGFAASNGLRATAP